MKILDIIILTGCFVAAVYDVQEHRIPDALTHPLLILGVILRILAQQYIWISVIFCSLVFGMMYFFNKKEWMGGGDVMIVTVIPLYVPGLTPIFLYFVGGIMVIRKVGKRLLFPNNPDKYGLFGPVVFLSLLLAMIV